MPHECPIVDRGTDTMSAPSAWNFSCEFRPLTGQRLKD